MCDNKQQCWSAPTHLPQTLTSVSPAVTRVHTSVPTRKALTRVPALMATPRMTMEGIAMVRIREGEEAGVN